jgi:hypothetical protein
VGVIEQMWTITAAMSAGLVIAVWQNKKQDGYSRKRSFAPYWQDIIKFLAGYLTIKRSFAPYMRTAGNNGALLRMCSA